MNKSENITVKSFQGDYHIESFDLVSDLFLACNEIENAFYIVDKNVYKLYKNMQFFLKTKKYYLYEALEKNKTLSGLEKIFLEMQSSKCSKRTTIIAIGGGITQDISTLAAHLWYRGIPFIYVPTTLLSMADSAIGAKCALNIGSFKNQVGTFQSPQKVFVTRDFINTLEDTDIMSGWGEIVKLSIIESRDSYLLLQDDIKRDGFKGPSLERNIMSSFETKRQYIEKDEYENNIRKVLNYGHTFGHALEKITNNKVPHGIAVVWGIDIINYIAHEYGILNPLDFENMHIFLHKYFSIEFKNYDINAHNLLSVVQTDKKANNGKITFIFPRCIGDVATVEVPIDKQLFDYVDKYLKV